MKHVIVIETVDPSEGGPEFSVAFQSAVEAEIEERVGEPDICVVRGRWNTDSAIEAVYEMYNAPKWNRGETWRQLVEAAKSARRALNLGLNLAYARHDPDDQDKISCAVCHRSWPIHINEDRTAGAQIEHDPKAICGIMHAALNGTMNALDKAGEPS